MESIRQEILVPIVSYQKLMGAMLKHLRKGLDHDSKGVCEAIDMKRAQYFKIERGEAAISLARLYALAEHYDTTMLALMMRMDACRELAEAYGVCMDDKQTNVSEDTVASFMTPLSKGESNGIRIWKTCTQASGADSRDGNQP